MDSVTAHSEDSVSVVLQKILAKLNGLSKSYKELAKGATFNSDATTAIERKVSVLERDLKEEKAKVRKLEMENHILRTKQTKLANRIDEVVMDQNRCVLNFTGFQDSELRDDVVLLRNIRSCLNHITNFNGQAELINIRSYRRIGAFKRGQLRIVQVEFESYNDVSTIMENKRQLPQGVYVNEQLPPQLEQNRQTMLKVYLYARSLDGYRRKCRLERDKFIAKGKTYTVDNLHELPEEISLAKTCEKRNDDITAFFGKGSPLSNFYPCKVNVQSKEYTSVEKAFQCMKAEECEDTQTLNAMLKTEDPVEIKRLGKRITNNDKWQAVSKDIMFAACLSKFTDNIDARNHLLGTGNTLIAEASPDQYWGTGVHLSKVNSLNVNNWSGDNVLGQILMKVRDELHKMSSQEVLEEGEIT